MFAVLSACRYLNLLARDAAAQGDAHGRGRLFACPAAVAVGRRRHNGVVRGDRPAAKVALD